VQITSRRQSREQEPPESGLSRGQLAAPRGREFWRSLEELADTPEFQRYVQDEFPEGASEFEDPAGRRRFLKLMGASIALAAAGGACAYQPTERYAPYVRQPEELTPAKALFFATAMPRGGIGLLVRSNAGRPTKVEGNPRHPASLGHTDIFAQASVLQLYDPDRARVAREGGEPSSWERFLGAARNALEAERPRAGAGLRILTDSVNSPTFARQMRGLLSEFPQARWVVYEPAGRDNARQGAIQAFGKPLNAVYRLDQAARVLSVDSDFLAAQGGANLRYAHDFMTARSPAGDRPDISNRLGGEVARLYAVECAPSQTGAKADHRYPLRPSEVETFMRAVASELGIAVAGGAALNAEAARWAGAAARDLAGQSGRSAVIVGDARPPAVHALGHAINAALGATGKTVYYTEPVDFYPDGAGDQISEFRNLVGEMNAGKVKALLIVGGNPVYNAPADLPFGEALGKVPFTAHLSLYLDETSERCDWQIPESHFLEQWGDARAFDGTISLVQPLIDPLYQSKSAIEFIGALSSQPQTNGYEIVRATYAPSGARSGARPSPTGGAQAGAMTAPAPVVSAYPPGGGQRGGAPVPGGVAPGQTPQDSGAASQGDGSAVAGATSVGRSGQGARPAGDFEAWWRSAVHDGVVPNSAFEQQSPRPIAGLGQAAPGQQAGVANAAGAQPAPPEGVYEIVFAPDPTIHDGRYANNGWLQELPKPLTTLTWENAAIVSPRTAERLGAKAEAVFSGGGFEVSMAKLSFKGREVVAPLWILPGQPDGVVTAHLGYGRRRAGGVGDGAGFDAYRLRTSDAMWGGPGLKITLTGERTSLASTQAHFTTEGRDPVRVATFEEFRARDEKIFTEGRETPPPDLTLYPNYKYDGHRWGMAIDNHACVGCNACVVACQSENNVPVVGKPQVLRSREMHWLHIDTYYRGAEETKNDPEGPYFEPLMCVHCEYAPCEPVCPVHATVHDAEGLNVQVYNRCIGTRYCSNNCPYKVRRFNFLLYQDWETEQYKMMRNPEVTVRSRGVMEKCTYCVQRIEEARIIASREGRKVRDGEVVTACQAACPTEAIVFGDLNDPGARVTRIRETTRRGYPLLGELNTRPRSWHLGELRNPNPEMTPGYARKQEESPAPPVASKPGS
jgi:molybdopterin-containing oxidoreductase family iron-sulfur binding subunit